jgi:hypothetical protein
MNDDWTYLVGKPLNEAEAEIVRAGGLMAAYPTDEFCLKTADFQPNRVNLYYDRYNLLVTKVTGLG